MGWDRLGSPEPGSLAAARAAAHWAVQTVSAVGETLLPAHDDTSHTASTWSAPMRALEGGSIANAGDSRVALRFDPFELLLVDADGQVEERFALAGRSVADADAWVEEELQTALKPAGGLRHPAYALPSHPFGEGAPLDASAESLVELGRWYGNAALTLEELCSETPEAGAVLCWPHHFDIATLLTVESDASGAASKTIGMGFSPGDEGIADPYWYVNHWPGRSDAELPALPVGAWHREGWVGALLAGAELVAAGDAAAQHAKLRAFLRAGIDANRSILS